MQCLPVKTNKASQKKPLLNLSNLKIMANTADFNAKPDTIQSIPNDQVQTPLLPIDVFLQEAENLYQWSNADARALAAAGIKSEMISDLQAGADVLRKAQSLWLKDRYTQKEAQKKWTLQSPGAYELRDKLLHDFRFAFRKDPTLLSLISQIANGTKPEEMIQDLNDLSVLGKANPEPLAVIGTDAAILDLAAQKADEMANLLAKVNSDKARHNASKEMRDKAYTYLKALVDEIREAGKYVFWKDEIRYRGYTSAYWRKHNRNRSNKPTKSAE